MVFMDNKFIIPYSASEHEIKLTEYFSNDGLRPKGKPFDNTTVILAFTNRSGSNYLAECMQLTGISGLAGEWFNHPAVKNYCDLHEIKTLQGYIRAIARSKKGPENRFAAKVSWAQLYFLTRIGMFNQLMIRPKFILIRRRDLLNQAISFFIAQHTKKWTSTQHGTATVDSLVMNKKALVKIVNGLAFANSMFETYFSVFGVEYVQVYYEDLIADPKTELNKISNFVSNNPLSEKSFDALKAGTKKSQSTQINHEFRQQFLSESCKKIFAEEVSLI